MKFDTYNVLGKKISNIELSNDVFGIIPHNQAMFDLVLAERASLRQGTHSTKTRTEVSGGGRKPWRQKGTGRARQGSIRSPQWKGGGVVFGPNSNKNYDLKINKKVKKLALKSGWSYKAKENAFILIDNLDFKNPSSKDFRTFLKNVKSNNQKILLILSEDTSSFNLFLSAKNFKNVLPIPISQILLDNVLNSDKIIMTEKTAKELEERLNK